MNILWRWLIITVAIIIIAYILPGVSISSPLAALAAAAVLGLLNVVLKPIIVILTLPLNILTLGLFTLVINALIIILAAMIVPGLEIVSFWWAVLFGLILSLINSLISH